MNDELKILKEENNNLMIKLKKVATYCQDLKNEKEALFRKNNEKEEEIKALNQKINYLEKKIDDSYSMIPNSSDTAFLEKPFEKDNSRISIVPQSQDMKKLKQNTIEALNRNSTLRYSLTPNTPNITKKEKTLDNVNINLVNLHSKKPDIQFTSFIKKLREEIEHKNKQIINLNDEILELRKNYEEEKAKQICNYNYLLEKITKNNIETEFIKVSKELAASKFNCSVSNIKIKELEKDKSDLQINIKQLESINSELKKQLENKIESYKLEEKSESDSNKVDDKKVTKKLEFNEKSFSDVEKNSKNYENVCKDLYYKQLNSNRFYVAYIDQMLKENRKFKFLEERYKQDCQMLSNSKLVFENRIIELEATKEYQDIQLKGNFNELEYLREKNEELKSIIDELKFSKKVYIVSYYYLGLPYEGKFVFERSESEYSFTIVTKTSTRRMNLLDCDLQVNENIKLKLTIKNFGDEEYYSNSNEVNLIMSDFSLFKKKFISTSKLSTINKSGENVIVAEKTETKKELIQGKEKKVMDIFNL